MKNLHQQVLELLPQCIEDRRWLHRHAELSFREYKTADYLEQALCELEGLELSRPTPTSVMAVLRTGTPFVTLVFNDCSYGLIKWKEEDRYGENFYVRSEERRVGKECRL